MSRAEELRPMRNVLAHGYFMVDMEIVWKTIKNDLPNMAAQISHLMKTP